MNPLAVSLAATLWRLRAVFAERDAWRRIALCALQQMTALDRELQLLSPRPTNKSIARIRRAIDFGLDVEVQREREVESAIERAGQETAA